MKIFKKIAILVLILAVPGFLYYLLEAKGKNRYKPLAIYGPKQVASTSHKFHGKVIPDTIYHRIPDFALTDQDGNRVSLNTYKGQIIVASFFYTQCPTVCNTVNNNIDVLAHGYAKNKMIHFLSFTVNPQHDSPTVLKGYSAHYKWPAKKWSFLTGDTSTIYNLARKGMLVNAMQAGNNDFIYSDKLILIDPLGRIRGYYSGTISKEVVKLDEEIKVQIAEELRKVKSGE